MKCHKGAWLPLVIAALCLEVQAGQYIQQECSSDDFRCNNQKCIESSRVCDRVTDCPDGEDERDCACGPDEIQCTSDGACIESRKRCDSVAHCLDGSDELECAKGHFKCSSGRIIPESLRCNRHYDCPDGDYSDEHNCPCGVNDFKCKNGHCIPKSKRCDRTHDCQDSSDELQCTYGKECMAYQFKCTNGQCVHAESHCNGSTECADGSDEIKCPCKRGQFRCHDGNCINIALRCNGRRDCRQGEDEINCEEGTCPAGSFTCDPGSKVQCAIACNSIPECDNSEDEDNCQECQHECDNRCLEDKQICDGHPDCSDGSDEEVCDNCDGPEDFRCLNGDCIKASLRCNEIPECSDSSDEMNCTDTLTPILAGCTDNQYRCRDSTCINVEFWCDGRQDCIDGSDEENCPCADREFQCSSRECIADNLRCNGIAECSDGSDEQNCVGSDDTTQYQYPPYTTSASPVYTTTARTDDEYSPGRDPYGSDRGQSGYPDRYNPYGSSGSESRPDNRYPYGSSTERRPDYTTRPTESYDPYGPATDSDNPSYPSNNGGDDNSEPTESVTTRDQYPETTQSPDAPYNPYGTGASQSGSDGNQPSLSPYDPYGGGYPYNPYGSSTSAPSTVAPGSGGDPYGGGSYPYPSGSGSAQGGQSGYPDTGSGPYGGGSYPNAPGGGAGQGSQSGYPSAGSGQYGGGSYPNTPNGGSGQDSQSGYPSTGNGPYGGGSYPNAPGGGAGQGSESGYPDAGSDPYGGGNYPNAPSGSTGQGGQSSSGGRPWSGSQSGGPVRDPVALDIKTYPQQQSVRFGGDVVFQCRDEGPLRAPVRWVKEGGRSLKPGSIDRNGRLELFQVTKADSGVYICQTPRYLGKPGSEVRVTLVVENERAPPARPAFAHCAAHEATCGNGACIPKSLVCDGKIDCPDRSDEDMCSQTGKCEPNQFQCENHKCVLKTWLCDSEDDCGDGSDELNCIPQKPGQPCLSSEFSCATGGQCVPRSFHCDGRSDCLDKSDEIGCAPVYVVKPPTPSNIRLNTGDTLVLQAEAKGNPVPVISWRLNWGHVPPQCTSTSENGIGILTCPNMQPIHSGAYSAEALNNKGTTFANPDAIVFVSQTSPCPPGYFNNEARSEKECIRCFCFGESTQCHSADLFTYNMPTPLGQGGTRLQGVTITPSGEIRTDGTITYHYYYQPLRNGATITKLVSYDESSLGSFHPYLTLPESYNGQQLTSYGGHIKYSLAPHSRAYDYDDSAPTIIVKGKYATLFYFHRQQGPSNDIPVEVRLTPENWVKPGPIGYEPAAREDIMMALDQVETILLRADLNNAGVNISNFVMESAQHINIGLGAASLVEECTCPPGYEGLSCQKCSDGYVREKSGPWLGNCVREACPPGTYGDPASGLACKPCPCPLTNRENQFARTCSLGPDGRPSCDCFPGYEGQNCEKCTPGFKGNPLVYGDTCRVIPTERCNSAGTETSRLLDDCVCKDNVQGRYCDHCKNNSFYLSNDFRYGCALCFCSGVSTQCMSSNLRRKTTSLNFNVPNIIDQVKVYNSAPVGATGLRYGAPAEIELKPVLKSGGLTIRGHDRSHPTVYYWSMPLSFAGDKVTSYGGYLRYTLDYVPTYVSVRSINAAAADVQLISDNHLTFQFTGNFKPTPEGLLNASVQFLETGWHRSDGKEVSREHFLLALADVKAILIKATYGHTITTLLSASIETAEPGGSGPAALHVEQCMCPTGYIGTSCEDCAPGYTRSSSGLYLKHCGLCDCNGRSRQCHPETGICYACMDNTDGPHCELCKPGYESDGYDNCVEIEGSSSTSVPCRCDPRGSIGPCDASGRCSCKKNVEGANCDRCRAGTFGLEASNPDGCIECFCSGATQECQEANHYTRIAMAAPIFGDDYGGYILTDLNAENVINDQFVPVPDKSELMYVFSYPPNEDLFWSVPVFPGNRVASYGGSISLRQEFKGNTYNDVSRPGNDVVLVGDALSVYWTNPNQLRSGQTLNYQVPLVEQGWYRLGTTVPASRSDFMRVLKNLRRVLVRATISHDIASSTIADVSMDTATETFQPDGAAALGVEICTCPPGHLGTSCESCAAGYYKDAQDYCTPCPCAGHDCQLDSYGQVTCNCRPPYTGPDCSAYVGESQTTTVQPLPPQMTVTVRITSPTIRIQEVGSDVNFTCQAQSSINTNPLPITWTKKDGYLPQGRVYVDQRSGLLQITHLEITDTGVYVCHTNDGISSGQAQVTLRVPANKMSSPSVSIRPAVNEYYEGDRIELECVAQGNPAPSIFWKRASRRPLPIGSQQTESLFIIESAREEDSGEYSCIASNTVGSNQNIAVINVRPRPSRPPRDRLMVTPTAPVVDEDQSTRVVCTGSTSVPTGTIDWVRQDNGRFQANVRSDNGILYIDNATLDNQGVYICQTHAADVAPVPVLVTVNAVGTPPPGEESEISVPVTQLKISTGESGTVECTPSGSPMPRIRWSRHKGEFGSGASQRGDMLIINNAQESDQGYYVCEGFINDVLLKNIYVYVEIDKREEPKIQITPEGEIPVPLGSQFEFRCYVSGGIPEPFVSWSRSGGRTLTPTTSLLQNNILRFEKVDVNDGGEYTCTASNDLGSASASAVIRVRETPYIILTPANYNTVRYGEPITVVCRGRGIPEPMVSIRGPDRRDIAPPSPSITHLRISAASVRDDGDYTCTATSDAGTVEETFVVRVDRGDGGFADVGGSGESEINPGESDPNFDPNYGVDYNPNYNPNYNQAPNPRPSDLIVHDGQPRTEVDCKVNGNFGARWDRSDRQPLQRNAIQEGNKLVIFNVSKVDSGEYVCSMYNYDTGNVQAAHYISLLVVRPPRITLRPPTQTVRPGQSPTVECVVEGDDILEIRWIPYNRNPSRRVEIRNSTLIFHQIEVEDAGEYQCLAKSMYANASAKAEVIVADPRDTGAVAKLVKIEQPQRRYITGENVEVLCRALSPNANVNWEKFGTRQYVEVRRYKDGAMLIIHEVNPTDAGVYRCTTVDANGRTSYDDFNLEVEPGNANPTYPRERNTSPGVGRYTARLRESIDIPCNHKLEEPVNIKWRRLYSQLPSDTRSDQPMLHLTNVNEADAGTYVCRVSNNRAAVEERAILRVVGVIPSFNGDSWIALPNIKDAYRQFDIEVSFRPTDGNGLILYNSQFPDNTGDFLALQLVEGIPQFVLETGNGPIYVKGDRPLTRNDWHTIRLSRIGSQVTMDVDYGEPFANETSENWLLDLQEPLYIGGVRDLDSLPAVLAGASGFAGCISMLNIGREEKNIIMDSLDQSRIEECDPCAPNLCLNDGVCQEARNERGFICICANGFAGQNCVRRGEACHPGLCGPGKCQDTADGYKCACPVTHTGKHCEETQSIEYPAFTGSAYLALKPPNSVRYFKMAMKVKATAPVQDGIIMYCAESARGLGGFTSLAVRNKKIEFRYDLNEGNPVVLVSNTTLPANEWTDVQITRVGAVVSLNINVQSYEQTLGSANKSLKLETPMFVGGVDETIILNNNTGVTGGFSGCIKDLQTQGNSVNIVNSSILSANVQECTVPRGDIPEMEPPCPCSNGASCNPDGSCNCPPGFTGYYCESRLPSSMVASRRPVEPCAVRPCRNKGICRVDYSNMMNHTCDCPLGFAGATCQMSLQLYQSVGFNGNGYLELPSQLIDYETESEPAIIALAVHTTQNGVLLYQTEMAPHNYGSDSGDYVLLRVERGYVILEWDMGSGTTSLTIDSKDGFVTDGERHQIIVKFLSENKVELTVDSNTVNGYTNGFASHMNADSNIYIGGIPERLNIQRYPGLVGCVEQVEFNTQRAVNLGEVAVAGRNAQRCRESRL